MADVYVNALTTISTEPTTTDSLVAVNRNTNEGKIIDYNKLADVILNKLTSKQYSGLNTTSKLLVGAINELDSDVSSLNSRLNIKLKTQQVSGEVTTAGGFVTLEYIRPSDATTIYGAPIISMGASNSVNSLVAIVPLDVTKVRVVSSTAQTVTVARLYIYT